jgi:hypothetical protein
VYPRAERGKYGRGFRGEDGRGCRGDPEDPPHQQNLTRSRWLDVDFVSSPTKGEVAGAAPSRQTLIPVLAGEVPQVTSRLAGEEEKSAS